MIASILPSLPCDGIKSLKISQSNNETSETNCNTNQDKNKAWHPTVANPVESQAMNFSRINSESIVISKFANSENDSHYFKSFLSDCDICKFYTFEILIPGLDGYKCQCGWIGSCRQCKGLSSKLLSIGICPRCDWANRQAALERKRKRGKGGRLNKKAIAVVGGAK